MCRTVNKMLKGDSVGSYKETADPIHVLLRATKSWSKKRYTKTEAAKMFLLSVLRDAEE
jgi:hypothetical protein